MRKTHFICRAVVAFLLVNPCMLSARGSDGDSPMPLPSIPATNCPYTAGSLSAYTDAKTRVDFYEAQRRNPTATKNSVTYSFKIDINDLDCYITNATMDKMEFLHFVLGTEAPSAIDPRPPLRLYIAGVNSEGKHIYVEDNTGNFFILQCAPSPENALPPEGTPPLYTTGTYKAIIKTYGSAVVAGGKEMVEAYYNNTVMDRTASSFAYGYDNFLGYINDAKSKGCDMIQFYLAQDCGRLTLVILGTKSGIPCYIKDPQMGVSVMDHLKPCPTCYDIDMGIATLETPTSN